MYNCAPVASSPQFHPYESQIEKYMVSLLASIIKDLRSTNSTHYQTYMQLHQMYHTASNQELEVEKTQEWS